MPPLQPFAKPVRCMVDCHDKAVLVLLGHDLRAAMSDVIGGLRLIDDTNVNAATRIQLDRARAASQTLARLLEDGLTQMGSRTDARDQHPCETLLEPMLRDMEMRWSGRAQEKGIRFQITRDPGLPGILSVDRTGLERALSNILNNAIKYTDTGGVTLSVLQEAGGGLRMTVRDQGPGFSKAALAQLFQRHGRPQDSLKPGSGLGLHIAKEMTDRLGAELSVLNLAAGGAEVTLRLPALASGGANGAGADQPDLSNPPELSGLPDLSHLKVLLAEDSATNQMVIGQMLGQLGAEVEIAGDGIEALTSLERGTFDLALIDIDLPRLSGIDVIRALRSLPGQAARTPVLALTAYVLRANREAINEAGANAIISKPVAGPDILGQAIEHVLGAAVPLPEDQVAPALAQSPILEEGLFTHLLEIAGPEGGRELITRLAADLGNVQHRLLQALVEPDWPEIRAQTHVLIALAGAVGAVRLQKAAEMLNDIAHRHDEAEAADLSSSLLILLETLIHYVSGHKLPAKDPS